MIALAAIILAAYPVGEVSYEPTPDQPHFGVVHYHNQQTSGNPREETVTVETQYGPVTFLLTRRYNNDLNPRDMLQVFETPAGVVAVPPVLELDEDTRDVILLYVWEGA